MSTSLIERLRRYADLIEGELVAGAPRKVGDAADCASPLMREAATLLDAHASALRDAAPVSPVVPVEPVTWEVLTLGEWRPTRFPDELRAKGFEVRTALASPPMAQAEPSEDTKRLRAALVGIEPHLPYDWAFTSVMEYIGQTAFQEAVAAVRAAIATLPSTPKEEEVKP